MKLSKSFRNPYGAPDHDKIIKYITLAILACLVMVIGIVLVLKHGNEPAQPSQTPSVQPSVTRLPVAMAQPVSAEQVASNLGCGNFTDLGPAAGYAVTDSGSCWINGKKYALDTFTSKEMRDAWLQAAEQLGVVPKWETPTSVTYPSVP